MICVFMALSKVFVILSHLNSDNERLFRTEKKLFPVGFKPGRLAEQARA